MLFNNLKVAVRIRVWSNIIFMRIVMEKTSFIKLHVFFFQFHLEVKLDHLFR